MSLTLPSQGDIGTSLIYVYSAIFSSMIIDPSDHDFSNIVAVKADVYGAMSLIFWTITLIALFKYVLVVLRANDTGEGELLLLACLRASRMHPRAEPSPCRRHNGIVRPALSHDGLLAVWHAQGAGPRASAQDEER